MNIVAIGIAQFVERPTEMSRAIAASRGFESPVRQGIVLPESTFSADCLTVSLRPRVQSHASTSVRTLKISNTESHTIVWTYKILHTLIEISRKAQRSTKSKRERERCYTSEC